jgi:hypothetical protein
MVLNNTSPEGAKEDLPTWAGHCRPFRAGVFDALSTGGFRRREGYGETSTPPAKHCRRFAAYRPRVGCHGDASYPCLFAIHQTRA